jgi:ribosomal protein L11 methylase PrmA
VGPAGGLLLSIAAARQYGIKGVGVDIDPVRIREAEENARQAGVTKLVTFRKNDLFQEDISKATVVTLYLLPEVNLKLRPKLLKELKPPGRA